MKATKQTTPITVSANTLMNVEQALKGGKTMTGPQIADSIKRDYTTVHRALTQLQDEGKIGMVKHGRFKIYFMVKDNQPEKAPKHPKVHKAIQKQETIETTPETTTVSKLGPKAEEIQNAARQYLMVNGPTTLNGLAKSLPYPRSSSYAALAEMRRLQAVRVRDDGLLEVAQPSFVVPGPQPLKGTATADLPTPGMDTTGILAQLVRRLTEQALQEALKPLALSHPDLLKHPIIDPSNN